MTGAYYGYRLWRFFIQNRGKLMNNVVFLLFFRNARGVPKVKKNGNYLTDSWVISRIKGVAETWILQWLVDAEVNILSLCPLQPFWEVCSIWYKTLLSFIVTRMNQGYEIHLFSFLKGQSVDIKIGTKQLLGRAHLGLKSLEYWRWCSFACKWYGNKVPQQTSQRDKLLRNPRETPSLSWGVWLP